MASPLQRRRIGLRRLVNLVYRPTLQRHERLGDVVVQDGVELPRQRGEKVMAHPLRFGTIDDADGALQALLFQPCRRGIAAQREIEIGDTEFVEKTLIAASE